jgi:myosin heavy subunit
MFFTFVFLQIDIHSDNGNEDVSVIDSFESLSKVGTLLDIDADNLKVFLTEKRISANVVETIQSPLSVAAAMENRDSFAKFLYATLFNWLVARINMVYSSTHFALFVSSKLLSVYSFFEIHKSFCFRFWTARRE